MKKALLVLVVGIVLLNSCKYKVKGNNGVTYGSPVEYNDYIVSRQSTLMKKIIEFGELAQSNLDSAAILLGKYEGEAELMIRELKGMPPFKDDSTLRNAAIRSFTFYRRVFADDYRQILAIRKNRGEETEEGMARMTSIVEKLTLEEEKLDKAFHQAQKNFAARNKMQLIDNSMERDFKKNR